MSIKMDATDYIAFIAAWYILVGGFKLYNDFSPPKYKRPMYAISGDMRMAMLVFLLWPIAGVRMIILERRFTGRPFLGKLLLDCLLLCGLLLLVGFTYVLAGHVTETKLIRLLLTFPFTWLMVWLMSKAF